MCDTAYPKSPVQMTNMKNFGCEFFLSRHLKEQELREKLRIANKLKHERLDEEEKCDEEVWAVFAGSPAENGEDAGLALSPQPTIDLPHSAVREPKNSEVHQKSIRRDSEGERHRDHHHHRNLEYSRYSDVRRRQGRRLQSRDSSHQDRSGFRKNDRRRLGNDWKYNSFRMNTRRETYRRI